MFKQTRLLKKNSGWKNWDIFHPKINYFYGIYCADYAGIPPWASEILPGRDGMKNVSASYKGNKKLVVWSRLLSRPVCYPVPARL